MTNIIYKDGQFQTEDGIPFANQKRVKELIPSTYFNSDQWEPVEDWTYSIREKVEVIERPRHYEPGEPYTNRRVARIVEEKEESEEHEVILNFFRNSEPSSVGEKPDWYTKEEIFHWLKHENYCEEIALELAGKVSNWLQGAFDKGVEKTERGARKRIEELESWKAEAEKHMIDYGKLVSAYAELEADRDKLREMIKDGIPHNCAAGYDEVKFCSFRNGVGNMCMKCLNF